MTKILTEDLNVTRWSNGNLNKTPNKCMRSFNTSNNQNSPIAIDIVQSSERLMRHECRDLLSLLTLIPSLLVSQILACLS